VLKEQKFFNALRDVFVGAKVEGESGFVNLMHIKSQYYEKSVFPCLKEDIDRALKPFPEFREEFFDRLYTFFRRYFSESGSIYFRYTPLHERVYEQVYTDDRDVVLFWKTHMLYYVKTDRLFRNMEVELDGFRFFFDVSTLEHKKATEKRDLVYEFKERREDGTLVFTVAYSQNGRITKLDDIRRAIKDALGLRSYTDAVPSEDTLERAFCLFERQSEVDYFINKDARKFLREQFNLWLYQYIFEPELRKDAEEITERKSTIWTETRIRQLQVLKKIAYKIIDFIAQFEDELVKIWNKPKFVLDSHYVITLDRIAVRESGEALLEKILAHPGMEQQVQEWRDLGMVGEDFTPEHVWETDQTGRRLHLRYRYLPLDTRYFPDLELAILGLFDHLDVELDGWLIHSENYQALNTLLPRFQGRVKCIYVDPPFNLDENADYEYVVNYKDAVWLTLLENRFSLARQFITQDGSLFCRVGHDGNMLVRLLLNQVFGPENYRNEIIVRRAEEAKGELVKQFKNMKSMMVNYDNLYWYSVDPETRFPHITKPAEKKGQWHSFWKAEDRPNLRYELLGVSLDRGQWMWSKERALKAVENYQRYLKERLSGETIEQYWNRTGRKLEFVRRFRSTIQYWIPPRDSVVADNNWLDIRGYSNKWGFKTENSEALLYRILSNLTSAGDLVMDFFLGSGTTTAVSHKLRRKWIGVEVGDHFHNVILRRMKTVAAGDQSGISQEVNWQGGGFFKYFRLEQYEETLRRAHYEDVEPLFIQADPYSQYVFMRDKKMLDNAETNEKVVEIDTEKDEIRVDPGKLYDDIDLAETLSCVIGKWIRRIHPDPDNPTKPGEVEFEDGERVNLKNPPWKLIKPLIWW
jgi:adenine specific DNA methylase Mod